MTTIRRLTLALCAAIFLGGLPFASATAAASAWPDCSSDPWTAEVVLEYEDSFDYTLDVSWCVEGKKTVWAKGQVTHEESGDACTWVGRMEEQEQPVQGSDAWIVYDMSEFACRDAGEVTPRGVNPWARVLVYPDGTFKAESDIED